MEINAQNNSSKNTDFQSLVDLTVVGLNQIEGYLRVGINQVATKKIIKNKVLDY